MKMVESKEETKIKLKEIEQEVKLGSVDTTIIAIFVFTISIFYSAKLDSIKNPYLLVGLIYSLAIVIPLIYAIFQYSMSIFFSDRRFSNKIDTLTMVYGFLLFIGLFWFLIFIVYLIEKVLHKPLSPCIVWSSFIVIVILAVVMTFLLIKPQITAYFRNNFPNLLIKKINKMNRTQRQKALRHLGVTYSKLKKLANDY